MLRVTGTDWVSGQEVGLTRLSFVVWEHPLLANRYLLHQHAWEKNLSKVTMRMEKYKAKKRAALEVRRNIWRLQASMHSSPKTKRIHMTRWLSCDAVQRRKEEKKRVRTRKGGSAEMDEEDALFGFE